MQRDEVETSGQAIVRTQTAVHTPKKQRTAYLSSWLSCALKHDAQMPPIRDEGGRPPLPVDYDSDPTRFLANQVATASFSSAGDVHAPVAERLRARTAGPVLDLGGGNGTLARLLIRSGVSTVVLDQAAHIHQAPLPAVRADAQRLPFKDGGFGAVSALWMLYHLPDPHAALIEADRVLRAGGTFVACSSSRFNDPEVAGVLPDWGDPFSFDAESAPAIVSEVFDIFEIERWDAPMVTLPDSRAVELFLRGRGLTEHEASVSAHSFPTPLDVTKRGVLIWAVRRTGYPVAARP